MDNVKTVYPLQTKFAGGIIKDLHVQKRSRSFMRCFQRLGREDVGEKKTKKTFSHLNHLVSGHSKLNNHQSKINKEISNLCDMCNIPEDLNHFLFGCKKFDGERIQLQEKVEEILHREDANHIGNIDMKVLTGMVEDNIIVP